MPITFPHFAMHKSRLLSATLTLLTGSLIGTTQFPALADPAPPTAAAQVPATQVAPGTEAPPPTSTPEEQRAIDFKAANWDMSLAGRPLELEGCHLTFEDNFDTPSVTADSGKGPWFAALHSDFGAGKIMPPGPDGPYIVKDGQLTLRASKIDGKWQTAIIQTVDSKGHGFAQQYGYFEMRARMPIGGGTWPAFWLLSQNGITDFTKTRTEIDTVEWYGSDPKGHHASVHLWPAREHQPGGPLKHLVKSQYSNLTRWQERFKLDVPPLQDGQLSGWHTYGAEITPDWVIAYFDRHELARFPMQPEYHTPLYMLVNMEMKVASPEPGPLDLNVDYVRAYAKK